MAGSFDVNQNDSKETIVRKMTSFILHKHYEENDIEAVIGLFDDKFSWVGAGEKEYATGTETVSGIFRQFKGKVPKCNIWDEQYDVMEIVPDAYLCTGRFWVATDPSVNMYLRVHQRIAAVFSWKQGKMYCCHIHFSNPYQEMTEEDVGFPTQMGKQSCVYLQECVEQQKKQIEKQTKLLERMSYEDLLTGLYNRNKYNRYIEELKQKSTAHMGVACFDLNALKEVNDSRGHSAGDTLICSAAEYLKQLFLGKTYRIGGDEFVVIDTDMREDEFKEAVDEVCARMYTAGISMSAGISWRSDGCDPESQFEEADKNMYREKVKYYSMENHNRRKG